MIVSETVALVTGAGRGIGRATAEALWELGAAVVIVDIDGAAATAVARTAPDASRALAVTADVSSPAGVQAMFTEAVKTFGRVDVVHNNAGYIGTNFWPEIPLDDAARTVAVNLGGVALGTLAALAHMVPRGSGLIVNTASIAGLEPNPIIPLYGATKAGVIHLTMAAAASAANTGVRVNCLVPSLVDTDFADRLIPPDPPEWMRPYLAHRIASRDVAAAVVELIRDDTRHGEQVPLLRPSTSN